jgi:hypothetical protein
LTLKLQVHFSEKIAEALQCEPAVLVLVKLAVSMLKTRVPG